jgi:quinol monooxygenase YgiN
VIICTLRLLLSEIDRCRVIASLAPLTRWTEVQPGCRSCYLLADIEEPRALILWEEWETQEDLDRHLRSEDYRRVIAAMELSQEAPEVHFHTVATRGGFEVIESVRGPRKQ